MFQFISIKRISLFIFLSLLQTSFTEIYASAALSRLRPVVRESVRTGISRTAPPTRILSHSSTISFRKGNQIHTTRRDHLSFPRAVTALSKNGLSHPIPYFAFQAQSPTTTENHINHFNSVFSGFDLTEGRTAYFYSNKKIEEQFGSPTLEFPEDGRISLSLLSPEERRLLGIQNYSSVIELVINPDALTVSESDHQLLDLSNFPPSNKGENRKKARKRAFLEAGAEILVALPTEAPQIPFSHIVSINNASPSYENLSAYNTALEFELVYLNADLKRELEAARNL